MSDLNKNESVHSGHRQRLREEFIESGAGHFSDIRALELLLTFAIPRKDTNPVAHALIDRFGSLYNVFSASYDELRSVDGVGESAAVLLRLVPDVYRKSESRHIEKSAGGTVMKSVDSASAYIRTLYAAEKNEKFMIFHLNAMKRLIKYDIIATGTVNSVNVDIRSIVEKALAAGASACIIAHNHPDGNPSPSRDDLSVTGKISDALGALGITLADHIIVSPDSCYSFREHNCI